MLSAYVRLAIGAHVIFHYRTTLMAVSAMPGAPGMHCR